MKYTSLARSILKKHAIIIFALLVFLFVFSFVINKHVLQSFNDFYIPDVTHLLSYQDTWSSNNLGGSNTGTMWVLFPLGLYFYVLNKFASIFLGVAHYILFVGVFSISLWAFTQLVREMMGKSEFNTSVLFTGGLFFCCNLFTVTQLSSSFLLVLPYLALPLQLLFLGRIFKLEINSRKYLYALSLVNSIVFSVNLVFGVVAYALFISYGIWQCLILKEVKLLQLFKAIFLSALLTFGLMAWSLVPMIASGIINKDTTAHQLSSEGFYNNSTTPANEFRLLGDWGFFGSNKGIPYKDFSSIYNSPVVTVVSYFPFILVLLLVFHWSSLKNKRHQRQVLFWLALLVVVLPFVGGINSDWPTSKIMALAFNEIPFFKAFRNTYKWMELVALACSILITVFLQYIYTKLNTLSKRLILLLTIVLVCVVAFPFFSGSIISKHLLLKGIPEYWKEMALKINTSLNSDNDRILLLPDQYFTAFNWEGGLKIPPKNIADTLFHVPVVYDTCIGCVDVRSDRYVEFVLKNIGTKDLSVFLGLSNISHILQRNDINTSYYNSFSNKFVKDNLKKIKNLSHTVTQGLLDLYQLNKEKVNDRWYSPKAVFSVDSMDDASFLFKEEWSTKNASAYVFTGDTSSTDDFINEGYTRFTRNLFTINDSHIVESKLINPISFPRKGNYIVENQNINSLFSDKLAQHVLFTKQDEPITKISLSAPSPGEFLFDKNLINNRFWKNKKWIVQGSNCDGAYKDIVPKVYLRTTNGKRAETLEIDAEKGLGCVKSLTMDDFKINTSYALSFDYRVIEGNQIGYCVWDGIRCLIGDRITSEKSDWRKANAIFTTKNDSRSIIVYLYAPAYQTRSINRYKNISIQVVKVSDISNISKATTLKGSGNFLIDLEFDKNNLITNPSFEKGLWKDPVKNCRFTDKDSDLRVSTSTLASEGNISVELYASKDLACIHSDPVSAFLKNSIYKLSFDYNLISFGVAGYCAWDGKKCLKQEFFDSQNQGWTTYSTLIQTDDTSSQISLYLYSGPSSTSIGDVLYDNVSITRVLTPSIDSYAVTSVDEPNLTQAAIQLLEKSTDRYVINVKQAGPSLLVFQELYQPGWRMYVSDGQSPSIYQSVINFILPQDNLSEVKVDKHIVVNSFANGWLLDPKVVCYIGNVCKKDADGSYTYKVVVEYLPRRFFHIGLVISSISIFLGVIFQLSSLFKIFRKKYKQHNNLKPNQTYQ